MNRDDTWKRYKNGHIVWNRWAKCMLQKREHLIRIRKWEGKRKSCWMDKARADFSGREFPGIAADFILYIFPGDVDFSSATFRKGVSFSSHSFRGRTNFEDAVFQDMAVFNCVKFLKFVSFRSCKFEGSADFGGTHFAEHANFAGVCTMDRFNLTNAKFRSVPDFSGGQFTHAPRLDGTRVHKYRIPEYSRLWKPRRDDSYSSIDGCVKTEPESAIVTNETGRWRALRSYAAEWHDFPNEDRFLVREFIARRQTTMNWWQPRFWVSLLYASLSRYGSSFMFPLIWWFLSLAVFAAVYTQYHLEIMESTEAVGEVELGDYFCRCYQQAQTGRYSIEASHSAVGVGRARSDKFEKSKVQPNDNACEYITAALGLSLANSVGPLATRNADGLRKQLFVEPNEQEERSTGIKSEPYVIATEVVQSVLSFVLLFLFALALRRQFRVM